MRRWPILATMIVAAAVAVMIGLGIWQLQRAEWKERLLAEYSAAESLPPLDLDPVLAGDSSDIPPIAYRRILVTCHSRNAEPQLRGGRSTEGASGYSYFVPCRPGADGLAGRIFVNAGWSAMPDGDLRISVDGPITGRIGAVEGERRVVLTSASASPPLRPSAAPGPETISNNHLLYALQWFFFAAAAVVIFLLALRRRGRENLPRDARAPKSRAP